MIMLMSVFSFSIPMIMNNNYYMILITAFSTLYTICTLNNITHMSVSFNFMIFDEFSSLLSILTSWIIFLTAITLNYNKHTSLFFFSMHTILLLCFNTANFLYFYIFFEMSLIPMIMLIITNSPQLERFQASMYMLMYTLTGSLPLLLMISSWNKNFSISMLFVSMLPDFKFYLFEILALMMAFLIKMPMYSLHLWLPKAHVEAPVTGSMILAGILLKLGSYGLYRIFIFKWNSLMFLEVTLFSLNTLGALYISLMCILQIDLKMLIAYSSVSHMSLCLLSFLSGNFFGLMGFLTLMLSHGLTSSCLFYMANVFYTRFHSRNMFLLKGMLMLFPSATFMWSLNCMINMNLPPTMSLLSEFLMISSIIKWNFFSLPFIITLSFSSSIYSILLLISITHGKTSFPKSFFNLNLKEFLIPSLHLLPMFLYILKIEFILLF